MCHRVVPKRIGYLPRNKFFVQKMGWVYVSMELRSNEKLAPMAKSKFPDHTIYTRINMGQKCEGNWGLWVLNEIIKMLILNV